jgi:hypothetical protein
MSSTAKQIDEVYKYAKKLEEEKKEKAAAAAEIARMTEEEKKAKERKEKKEEEEKKTLGELAGEPTVKKEVLTPVEQKELYDASDKMERVTTRLKDEGYSIEKTLNDPDLRADYTARRTEELQKMGLKNIVAVKTGLLDGAGKALSEGSDKVKFDIEQQPFAIRKMVINVLADALSAYSLHHSPDGKRT